MYIDRHASEDKFAKHCPFIILSEDQACSLRNVIDIHTGWSQCWWLAVIQNVDAQSNCRCLFGKDTFIHYLETIATCVAESSKRSRQRCRQVAIQLVCFALAQLLAKCGHHRQTTTAIGFDYPNRNMVGKEIGCVKSDICAKFSSEFAVAAKQEREAACLPP